MPVQLCICGYFSLVFLNYAGTLLSSNKGFLVNLILQTCLFANVIYNNY